MKGLEHCSVGVRFTASILHHFITPILRMSCSCEQDGGLWRKNPCVRQGPPCFLARSGVAGPAAALPKPKIQAPGLDRPCTSPIPLLPAVCIPALHRRWPAPFAGDRPDRI